jgi:hypothetical protein
MDPAKSKILLDESITPDKFGVEQDRFVALTDFHMLTMCNSKERTEIQWKELMRAADERLVVESIWREGSAMGHRDAIIQVGLKV